MRRVNNYTKTTNLLKILFIFIVFLGIGYAFLDAVLNIDGDVTVTAPELNVFVQSTSVTSGSTTGTPIIIGNDKKEVDFSTSLTNDSNSFFEETTTLVNKGTGTPYLIGVDVKVYDSSNNEVTLSAPYEYSITNGDGTPISIGSELAVNATASYKFKFNYVSGTDMTTVTDYPTYTFKITYNYTIASFANDTWAEIATNVTANPSAYPLGATKTIEMDLDGDNINETYTLRVANNTTPAECSTQGFSQSACGLVIEFADVITKHRMNLYVEGDTTTTGINGNGGWEYSDMRAYLNSTTYAYESIDYSSSGIYNALPADLKNKIIDTKVVSGHNNNETTNITTTDKLYLLSTKEVWGKEGTINVIEYDSAEAETRQLDYYHDIGVTTSMNYSGAIKQYNGSNSHWWLRAVHSNSYANFLIVSNDGTWSGSSSFSITGVAPAFRIGNNS